VSEVLRHGLSIVALVGAGILAGVLFATAISVVPAAAALPAGQYVRLHKLLGRFYDPTMPLISVSALVSNAVLATALGPDTTTRRLFGLSAALLFGVAVVSQTRNVPINRRVKVLDADALPADWRDPRRQWRDWNLVRTVLAILALAANASAVSLMS
jgi:uncharacterized membrane protein